MTRFAWPAPPKHCQSYEPIRSRGGGASSAGVTVKAVTHILVRPRRGSPPQRPGHTPAP